MGESFYAHKDGHVGYVDHFTIACRYAYRLLAQGDGAKYVLVFLLGQVCARSFSSFVGGSVQLASVRKFSGVYFCFCLPLAIKGKFFVG